MGWWLAILCLISQYFSLLSCHSLTLLNLSLAQIRSIHSYSKWAGTHVYPRPVPSPKENKVSMQNFDVKVDKRHDTQTNGWKDCDKNYIQKYNYIKKKKHYITYLLSALASNKDTSCWSSTQESLGRVVRIEMNGWGGVLKPGWK